MSRIIRKRQLVQVPTASWHMLYALFLLAGVPAFLRFVLLAHEKQKNQLFLASVAL